MYRKIAASLLCALSLPSMAIAAEGAKKVENIKADCEFAAVPDENGGEKFVITKCKARAQLGEGGTKFKMTLEPEISPLPLSSQSAAQLVPDSAPVDPSSVTEPDPSAVPESDPSVVTESDPSVAVESVPVEPSSATEEPVVVIPDQSTAVTPPPARPVQHPVSPPPARPVAKPTVAITGGGVTPRPVSPVSVAPVSQKPVAKTPTPTPQGAVAQQQLNAEKTAAKVAAKVTKDLSGVLESEIEAQLSGTPPQ